MYTLLFTETANKQLDNLETNPALKARAKSVQKTLGLLETNPRHPGLNTHKYSAFTGPNGEEVFEAYAQNKTPGTYRVFWYYGPNKNIITILTITPYP